MKGRYRMTTDSLSRDMTRTMFAVLLIGFLIGVSFWVVQPFLPALIWAAMIVVASWPLMIMVQSKLGGNRSRAVIVMTGGLLLLFVVPLSVGLLALINNMPEISEWTRNLIAHGIPQHPTILEKIPLVGTKIVAKWDQLAGFSRDDIFSRISPYIGRGFTWLLVQIGGIGKLFIHFSLTVIIAAILYAKGESAAAGILRFARRLAAERGAAAVILAGQAIRAVAMGVIITAVIQSLLAAIGLLVADVPYPVILTSLVFLLAVVQIGAAPVLLGVIIWLYHSDRTAMGTVFVLWSLVIMLSDNFIRPVLIRRGANIPLLLVFTGVIGGLISFGIVGLFIGPTVLAVSYTLLDDWIADQEPTVEEPAVEQ